MSTYSILKNILLTKRCGALALIDPDIKNDDRLKADINLNNFFGYNEFVMMPSELKELFMRIELSMNILDDKIKKEDVNLTYIKDNSKDGDKEIDFWNK